MPEKTVWHRDRVVTEGQDGTDGGFGWFTGPGAVGSKGTTLAGWCLYGDCPRSECVGCRAAHEGMALHDDDDPRT